jgi:hypothetical protein
MLINLPIIKYEINYQKIYSPGIGHYAKKLKTLKNITL